MGLIRKFIDWFCTKFNYYPLNTYERIDAVTKELNDEICKADRLTEELAKALVRIRELETSFDEAKYMDYKKIELENDRVRQEIKEMNEYYRKIQTEVSDILHGDKNFKFPYNLRLPGSTTLQDLTDDNMIHVCGRTGIPDTLRARFDNETSLVNQFNMLYNHLIQYKVINKMVDMIVQNGGLQLTVGYNEENTSGEIYYSMTVMKPEGMIIIKKENEEG